MIKELHGGIKMFGLKIVQKLQLVHKKWYFYKQIHRIDRIKLMISKLL
jgi:hypothetical protein